MHTPVTKSPKIVLAVSQLRHWSVVVIRNTNILLTRHILNSRTPISTRCTKQHQDYVRRTSWTMSGKINNIIWYVDTVTVTAQCTNNATSHMVKYKDTSPNTKPGYTSTCFMDSWHKKTIYRNTVSLPSNMDANWKTVKLVKHNLSDTVLWYNRHQLHNGNTIL